MEEDGRIEKERVGDNKKKERREKEKEYTGRM
jgi:hypothetical protein